MIKWRMLKNKHPARSISTLVCFLPFLFCSCAPSLAPKNNVQNKQQQELYALLQQEDITDESRFTVIDQIAKSFLAQKNHTDLVLFLTDYVEHHPKDPYNGYWLLMVAHSYREQGGTPIAEYYFERILNNYDDLLVKGESIHFTCLVHLIDITSSPSNRIMYFSQLISEFAEKISLTEAYARLAVEYEKLGEWEQMLKCYSLFKSQPDATTIQIAGIPNAYSRATQMLDFNASAKDWSFESLEELENAVRTAIRTRNYSRLDRYKSKVNFFAVSWRQDDTESANSQISISLANVMKGSIRCSDNLDESSNPTEAYLRTWGWAQNVTVWYFYFRKINFPLDPDVHGRWEWAGIYLGEKL